MDNSTLIAEQALLGACLLAEKSPSLAVEDFYSESNREIARVMKELDRQGVTPDLPTVGMGLDLKKANISYLAQLFDHAGSVDNIDHYSNLVRQASTVRKAKTKAESFLAQLSNPSGKRVNELLASLRAGLDDVGTAENTTISDMKTITANFIADLERRIVSGNPSGISTGISRLDTVTSGMAPQDLWIIAARPSQGKTALVLQIASNVAKTGLQVLFFSLDMRKDGLIERILASETRINLAKIRSGNLRPDELGTIFHVAPTIGALPITIIDKPCTELDIARQSRAIRPNLLIIDYLTKIEPSGKTGNANYDYGEISKAIKNLAKSLDIPILLLSQLSRLNERENRPPKESDLRDAGAIEQDADLILFIHSKDKALPERELIIAKQRQGQLARMRFLFDGAHQIFTAVEG